MELCGRAGKDDAAQYDDAALQTDTGIAFKKALADTAGGLTGKGCQRDWRNGCGNIEPEEPGVDGQNNDRGQRPDQQAAQQGHDPEGDAVQQTHILNELCYTLRQLHGHGVREPRGANHGGDNALGDLEERRSDVDTVGDGKGDY